MRTRASRNQEDAVRQVDLDELTFQLFSGLRAWTWSVRKRVFAPLAKRRDVDIKIATDQIVAKLRIWEFYDTSALPIPLARDTISACVAAEIDRFPGAVPGLWMSGVHDREREAQSAAAMLLAAALNRFEILSPTELEQFGAKIVRFRMPPAPDYAFQPRWP
jgi:hypothetical protein